MSAGGRGKVWGVESEMRNVGMVFETLPECFGDLGDRKLIFSSRRRLTSTARGCFSDLCSANLDQAHADGF